jgi:hypothetical protein
MELHVDAKMASLAAMFQMLQVPAEWIAFAKMRGSQDHFPFCPMRWFAIPLDAAPRSGICFVESTFAGALASIS